MKEKLQWKVNTIQLLTEVLSNDTTQILTIPLNILMSLLAQVAKRASEIDDMELNKLMLRLSLYSVSDPNSSEYNSQQVNDYLYGEIEE